MRDFAQTLLAWYDDNARILPWRARPGQNHADPYRVWLSEIMLQQTTVTAVKPYFERFLELWPNINALANASDDAVMAEWAGLGYYARARNLLACARSISKAGGHFPETRAELLTLPGIGPYTSAAIAAIAFGQPETVIDGNVERVISRLFAIQTALPAAKPELAAIAGTLTPQLRAGDYAQAMMDLGATICTPRKPACVACPVSTFCAACASNIAAELPRRAVKPEKILRHGIAWVAINDHNILLERRKPNGLLGGMLAFPTSGWDGSDTSPPITADWRSLGKINHVFTHFKLEMEIRFTQTHIQPQYGMWVKRQNFVPGDMPGLMRKVWNQVSVHLSG